MLTEIIKNLKTVESEKAAMAKEVDIETIVRKNEESSKMFNFFCESFPGSLEWIYLKFSEKQKKVGLECLLVTAVLFDIYMILFATSPMVLPALGFLILHVGLLVFCKMQISSHEIYCVILATVCAVLPFAQIVMAILMKESDVTPRDYLGWALLFDYLICLTLPLPLRYCVALSWGSCMAYLVTILVHQKPFQAEHVFPQIAANVLLLATSTILGITAYLVEDKHQRKTFLETRQSLEVKLVIEEQSAEQERLLLSVLPEHVAVQMRQDLDQADSQFKKIYMSRHENVSILYADIVGFTAISSTYSAQELVKMLNELFARFDKLAEKYEQLRIKILGDCYYCISGAPVERPDHAVLCVHMGLSMVDAIKYVQQTANSPVDMRVGIHTGAVLAGVLGQRQWQFDVYSKDVELANKMESSGKAGRVHISATTLSFLNGEFEVEPAFGEKRDEALRIAGLKTYFIVKVLKPFKLPKKVQNGDTAIDAEADNYVISEMKTFIEEKNSSEPTRARSNSEHFAARLMAELVSRDGYRQLAKKSNCFTLGFTDERKEFGYVRLSETSFIFLVLILLILRTVFLASTLIIQPSVLTEPWYAFPLDAGLLFFVLATAMFDCYFWASLVCSVPLPKLIVYKMVGAGICVLLLILVNFVDSKNCSLVGRDRFFCGMLSMDRTCLYPSYFSYFTVLILIGTSLPLCMRYWYKIGLMALAAFAQCYANGHYLDYLLDCVFARDSWSNLSQEKYSLCGLVICAAISMGFLSRHTEQVMRVLFLWRSEVEEQRHCAEDLKRRNEALVYNILPSHVAAHFMGNRNRNYDELYSQSYEEVGVLFASMPNFSDFYSEETVNNQGLECLRFLNEVISDFDALLELPEYQDIIKIKTIGSTYMAASGLNPSRQIKPEDPIQIRWAHLSLLVEFALDLKIALQSINEQSFNHFVLKMGINHGPITAGVIGARKPHYDIWGNTVNVASRMESTGKAGCIQVTEETCKILQAFDYRFEQRGLVAVKGKGQLMTYYLQGKSGKITPPTVPASPDVVNTMEIAKYPEEVDDDVFIMEVESSELQGKTDVALKNSDRFHGEPTLLRPLKLL